MVRKASAFKMRDITRALKGAEHAGVSASVDILRDGTIRLTPMPSADTPAADVKPKAEPASPGLLSWD